ncbi:hypothetical protein DFR44_13717 [Hydromonas duriensis]|uniref:Uncharacterized protein n=1 Tax=Hydromonas duriensis TaxID=1527608 RepID=A0A4R6Y487_9BURK|nr:hypothetical protein DFR44_13717 [Hydromonas duriensis]
MNAAVANGLHHRYKRVRLINVMRGAAVIKRLFKLPRMRIDLLALAIGGFPPSAITINFFGKVLRI